MNSSNSSFKQQNIQLIQGDIFKQSADLLVIPCSTIGTISNSFKDGLNELRFKFKEGRESSLGTINLEQGFKSNNFKLLAFATSVHNNTSSLDAIHQLGENLANLSNEFNFKSIAIPLLGTGAGNLDPIEVFEIFTTAFFDYNSSSSLLSIIIFEKDVYNRINDSLNKLNQKENQFEEAEPKEPFNSKNESKINEEIIALNENYEFTLNKFLNNDVWAEKDTLGYECYAKVISEMIKEESVQTKPPLTIAILAPWGQGKTTLMRYVERNLKETRQKLKNKEKENIKRIKNLTSVKKTRIADILSWLKNLPASPGKLSYPTVWFNPWKHQSCEQIWAGMAQAIISQIVEYLPEDEQEKFWFHLNLKRIDIATLKNKIFKNIISEFIQTLSIGLILFSFFLSIILLSFGIFILNKLGDFHLLGKIVTGFVATLGFSVPSVINFAKGRKKVLEDNLKDKFSDVVAEPDYNKKAGYFQEVEKDMEKVFDILISEDKPAVIFIDDLDRCSPNVVVEVIEAINLIINGDYRDKCYFIIGMDAKMVAASLDKHYAALSDKFEEEKNRFGDIGYYFLDKFIQLPFAIPIIKDDDRVNLLKNLFTQEDNNGAKKDLKDEEKK